MIKLKNVSVKSGSFSLDKVHLELKQGECGALMGVSGSGKTSLIEAICGIRSVESGEIWVVGKNVTLSSPADRNIGLVPQDNVLFPTMTVREQIGYGPKLKKWLEGEIEERVISLAEGLCLTPLLDRSVRNLSGGEAKRVAIARAMAHRPDLLCLDESFTGLDDVTHAEVMSMVKQMIHSERMTTLLVTHHQREAHFLADHCFSLEKGVVTSI